MHKRPLSVVLILILSSLSLYSQNRSRANLRTPPPISERVEAIVERLNENLRLTDEK
jgi:hypothetical protein